MTEVLAKDWKLGVGGGYDVIAGQQDGSMTLSHAVVDSTNKDSGNDRELIAGVHSWSFSASGCAEETDTGFKALWTAWNTKATLACRFTTPAANTYTGTSYISSYVLSGPYNGLFVFSLTLEGTGTLAT